MTENFTIKLCALPVGVNYILLCAQSAVGASYDTCQSYVTLQLSLMTTVAKWAILYNQPWVAVEWWSCGSYTSIYNQQTVKVDYYKTLSYICLSHCCVFRLGHVSSPYSEMKFYASDLFEVDKNSKTKTLPNHICTPIFLILDLHMYTYFSACLSWVELYHARNQDFFMAGDVCWDKDTSITISSAAGRRKAPQKTF